MSNVLITGGEGFIGSHLKKALPAQAFDLKNKEDIFDTPLLDSALKGKDTVIHLAALISANDSLDKEGEYYRVNVCGTHQVLEAAIKNKCKIFIFASSAAVYSKNNPYGLSKMIAEKILQNRKQNIKIIILRFFNVYGSGQNEHYAGVITKFMKAAKSENKLIIHGTGRQSRDFIFVGDLVEVVKKIISKSDSIRSGEVIEVGTGKPITINSLAKKIGREAKLEYEHKSNPGIYYSKAKIEKLMRLIGDFKFTSLEEGLEQVGI